MGWRRRNLCRRDVRMPREFLTKALQPRHGKGGSPRATSSVHLGAREKHTYRGERAASQAHLDASRLTGAVDAAWRESAVAVLARIADLRDSRTAEWRAAYDDAYERCRDEDHEELRMEAFEEGFSRGQRGGGPQLRSPAAPAHALPCLRGGCTRTWKPATRSRDWEGRRRRRAWRRVSPQMSAVWGYEDGRRSGPPSGRGDSD